MTERKDSGQTYNKTVVSLVKRNAVAALRSMLDDGLDRDASVYPLYQGKYPLFVLAAHEQKIDILEMLKKRGASMDSCGDQQWSALHDVVFTSRVPVVRWLIQNGANVNVRDVFGQTPLMCSDADHPDRAKEIVELLIEHGADINARANPGVVTSGPRPESPMSRTALIFNAIKGLSATIPLLLAKGAEVDACDDEKLTALHHAAENGYVDICKALLDAKAQTDVRTIEGWTPLLYACEHGQETVVRLLLDAGADPSIADNDGYTPLMKAAYRGKLRAVRAILKRKSTCALHAKNSEGFSAVMMAVDMNHVDVVRAMLDAGADVDSEVDRQTLLLRAVIFNQPQMAMLLLRRGADPYVFDTDDTPLLDIAQEKNYPLFQRMKEFLAKDEKAAADAAASREKKGGKARGSPSRLRKGQRIWDSDDESVQAPAAALEAAGAGSGDAESKSTSGRTVRPSVLGKRKRAAEEKEMAAKKRKTEGNKKESLTLDAQPTREQILHSHTVLDLFVLLGIERKHLKAFEAEDLQIGHLHLLSDECLTRLGLPVFARRKIQHYFPCLTDHQLPSRKTERHLRAIDKFGEGGRIDAAIAAAAAAAAAAATAGAGMGAGFSAGAVKAEAKTTAAGAAAPAAAAAALSSQGAPITAATSAGAAGAGSGSS